MLIICGFCLICHFMVIAVEILFTNAKRSDILFMKRFHVKRFTKD